MVFNLFLTNEVVNLRNNLPQTVVSAETVDTVKNKIDSLWKTVKYTTQLINIYRRVRT